MERIMRKKTVHHRVGFSKDAPQLIAEQIQLQSADGETIAWMDDKGDIWATNAVNSAMLPAHTVIGVYAFGVAGSDLVADISLVQQDRMRNWIDE
jgi:hypothetical protein